MAFSGGLTEDARQVVKTAAVVQAVTFALGVISLAGAGRWPGGIRISGTTLNRR